MHDMGESSCSNKMKKLIRRIYAKKPEAAVISIDYSSIVSGKIYPCGEFFLNLYYVQSQILYTFSRPAGLLTIL
jgi:hypothetical protein